MKELDLNGDIYVFETIEQLIDMLKDDNYRITLNVQEKGKIRKNIIIL